LGIGANTAMFTMLNTLALRPLSIPDPHGLVAVSSLNHLNQRRLTLITAVTELRQDGPLDPLCGINGGGVFAADVNGAPTQAILALETGGCFEVFGVPPLLGRTIADADAPIGPRGAYVAVIGHRFWTRMFAADPGVIGKTIRAEGIELTVIGVMPDGFDGMHIDTSIDIYAPFNTVSPARNDRPPGAGHLIGRLKPGVGFERASAELSTRWPNLMRVVVPATLAQAERSDLTSVHARVERMGTGFSMLRDRYVRPVAIIMGLTLILLVLACFNLGGLLLSRLTARSAELGIRLALGGSRHRIARQMIIENLLVSLCGAVLAVPAAFAIVRVLIAFLPDGLSDRALTFAPDWRVLAAMAMCAVAASILISAVPITLAWRRGLGAFGWDRTIAGATNSWARALLVAQVALSVIMLSGAGLLIRSLYLLQSTDIGVHTNVLAVRILPQPNAYRAVNNAAYYPALLDRISSMPGVRSAGFSRIFPRLLIDFGGQPIGLVGEPAGNVRASLESVSPGLFETIGVPILRGRGPTWADIAASTQVAMVSASLAAHLAPGGDIIGRRVKFGTNRLDQDVVVVGVVGNASQGNPRRSDLPVFYRPMLQTGPFANFPQLLVATEGQPLALATAIGDAIREGGVEYAHSMDTIGNIFARAPSIERMSATLAGAIATLAVLLAFIGVYALVAYSVSRRTREIGVRMAIGASRANVLRMVMKEGAILAAIGTAAGVPAAIAAGRVLETLLFGLTASDPAVLATTAAFFVTLGLVAGMIPALRAAAVDPAIALRTE
ncbi:MAG: ABC transporter permease, partial [Vicinamibacterales bacterium]